MAQTPASNQTQLAELYVSILGRAPDSDGLAYWASELEQGKITLEQIGSNWMNEQPEVLELYPDTMSNEQFINAIYQNVLNRDPDNAGLSYWKNDLDNGVIPKELFVNAILNGAKASTGSTNDASLLDNKTQIGITFAQSGANDKELAQSIVALATSDSSTVDIAQSIIELIPSDLSQITDQFIDSFVQIAQDFAVLVQDSTTLEIAQSLSELIPTDPTQADSAFLESFTQTTQTVAQIVEDATEGTTTDTQTLANLTTFIETMVEQVAEGGDDVDLGAVMDSMGETLSDVTTNPDILDNPTDLAEDTAADAGVDTGTTTPTTPTTPTTGGGSTGGSSTPADTTAPTATLTYSTDGGTTYSSTVSVRDADTLTIKATFSEAIADATGATITIGDSVLSTTAMTKVSDTVYTYSLNVPTGNVAAAAVTIGAAKDAAGNTISATPTNATFVIDNAAPTVSVTMATIGTTGNASVQSTEVGTAYLVNTGVTVNNLASITSAADNQWNSVAIATANSATNLAATGLADGTYSVYAVDAVGNLSSVSQFNVTVDATAPTITAQNGYPNTKTIVLTTDDTVSGTPSGSDFTVVMNDVSNAVTAVAVNGTSITLTLTNTITNGATVTVDYAQGSNTITDAVGNAIASIGDALSVTVESDSTAPTVSSVSSTANNTSYGIGDTIPITVTFTEAVTVTGTPQLTLETGNTDRTVDYASGSGSTTLTFNYTVQAGDTSSDLAYTATTALALNSGTIKDAAGNSATLTLPAIGGGSSLSGQKAIVVDGTVPTITAQEATAGTKIITLTTSETVTGTPNATDFTVLANSAANAVTAVNVSGTTITLTLTNAIQNSSTVTVDYAKATGDEISDVAGNAVATVGDALSVTVTNDNVIPTVTSVSSTANDASYGIGDTIPITVTFSEAVTVTGTPQLTLETGNTDRTVDYASGSGSTTLTFNYTVQAGDTASDLDYTATTALALNSGTIKDAAGNNATLTLATPGAANSLGNAKAIVVDGTVPTITAQEATAGTKTITLTASETVTGTPNASDFTVLANSAANAVTAVNVSGTTITLTLTNAIQNSSTVTVDYAKATGKEISDVAGNAIATVGDALSVTVTNDNTIPTVSSVSSTVSDGSYNIGDTIPITVTFTEAVTVTGTPQLTLETGNTDRTVDYASGSGSNTLTFNYTVQAGDTEDDALDYTATTALALNGGTIKDAAGNSATLTLATVGAANSISDNQAIVVDGTVPTIVTVGGSTSPSDGELLLDTTSGSGVAFTNITIDFSEVIQAASGVTLTNNIDIIAPTGSTNQSITFTATITDGNLVINLDENDADITGVENQPIYINIDNNTLQDAAGNMVVGISNSTDYNLFLSYI